MRSFLVILITSMSVLLSACNDNEKNNESEPNTSPEVQCQTHCAP